MAKQSDINKFVCRCGEAFHRPYILRAHQDKHHPNDIKNAMNDARMAMERIPADARKAVLTWLELATSLAS